MFSSVLRVHKINVFLDFKIVFTNRRYSIINTLLSKLCVVLVDLEVSSLGLISRGGFMTSPRIWAVAAVEGWLEMRVKVK